MKTMIHDLSVFLWGWIYDHPNWKETRIAFTPIIEIKRVPDEPMVTVQLRRPGIHILNAYEMESEYPGRYQSN